ncbi:MAG: hypothetical protein ABF334_10345 [Akkermansiaceae bacterium]
MPKNLIYTVAFDAEGYRGARTMAKILVSSLLRTMWSGDIIVFSNSPIPMFPVGRPGLQEVYCKQPTWKIDQPNNVTECLNKSLEWRFKSHHLIETKGYDKIIYLDCDCLCLRNLDHLFANDWDVLVQREKGRSIQDRVFSGYLSNKELSELSCDGINAGTIAVKASLFHEFMKSWQKAYEASPSQHEEFRDQTALNRLILDLDLRVKDFERGEVCFPFHIDTHYRDFRDAALLHMVGEGQREKIDFAFAFYMAAFFNDGQGVFLDFLEM